MYTITAWLFQEFEGQMKFSKPENINKQYSERQGNLWKARGGLANLKF